MAESMERKMVTAPLARGLQECVHERIQQDAMTIRVSVVKSGNAHDMFPA
jgi:hypothetical protein